MLETPCFGKLSRTEIHNAIDPHASSVRLTQAGPALYQKIREVFSRCSRIDNGFTEFEFDHRSSSHHLSLESQLSDRSRP